MQKMAMYILKALKKIKGFVLKTFDSFFTFLVLYFNGVKFSTFKSQGVPKVIISLGGKCVIGRNFKTNNREISNPIGRFHACSIFVGDKGSLIIGDNVGMSSTAIVCHNKIEIGDNVNLGGNVVIYDTDFHSIKAAERLDANLDKAKTNTAPVKIGNNAFIGAHTTILKGVTIGENSIIGACSVVTKSVPNNEIWAGNPAKKIREI